MKCRTNRIGVDAGGCLAICLACWLLASGTAVAVRPVATGAGFRPPGSPVLSLSFDAGGPVRDPQPVPDSAPVQPAPAHAGQAAAIIDKPLLYALPADFSAEAGTVDLWICPDWASTDNRYHRFCDIRGTPEGKANLFIYKSGDGGRNGLFMVVYDRAGNRVEAMARSGTDYAWQPGEWHHLAGSWDGACGFVSLWFDGREVATRRGTPFVVGDVRPVVAVGANLSGGEGCPGLVDEVRLYREPATQGVLVRTGHSAPDADPWKMLDGDTGDGSAWAGYGAPNFVDIELPDPIELARVIVHPGDRRNAPHPSTECSPKTLVVQGWVKAGGDSAWQDLSGVIQVPRYDGTPGESRVVVDCTPREVRKFRVLVTELYDEGKRLHSPTVPIVPAGDRSLIIRELEWRSVQELAEARARLEQARAMVAAGGAEWEQRFTGGSAPLGRAIRELYGKTLTAFAPRLQALAEHDEPGLRTILDEWQRVQSWLAPWRHCELRTAPASAADATVAELLVTIDAGDSPHEFYPAKLALDLRIVEAVLGRAVNPYVIDVMDLSEVAPVRCNSRFDRISPNKGTLTWTLRDRTHTHFALRFLPKPESPPELGMCTLGDGDHFYFDQAQKTSLPGDMWTCVFLDWDGDGRQDAIAGAWNDFCHLWRNVGTAQAPAFSSWEHFLITDETGEPLATNPEHHACTFSMVMPMDVDGDGRVDLFMDRYFGGTPTFYRNLGRDTFPVLSRGRKPVGLSHGKMAFGDLNGDGIADAIVVSHANERDTLRFHAGDGLDHNGAPLFGPGQDLSVAVIRAFNGGSSAERTTVALADTDADGDLDLYVVGPPHVWQHENTGTRTAFSFAAGTRLECGGKPLDVGFYYPSISWSDYDADGDLDLVKLTGGTVYLNDGGPNRVELGKPRRATLTQQRIMSRSNLKCQAMLDWDGDGDLDHLLPQARCLDLQVTDWQDGLFRSVTNVEVDPNKKDWFGCPDPTEYEALYALLSPFDWDGDGDVDLFLNSEHAWRFGYLHYYENLGDNRFAPELEWRPGGGTCDHIQFVDGKNGKAARIDAQTFLDYLSYPTKGCFDPTGGTIRFWFGPAWTGDDAGPHTFFHTAPTPAANGIGAEPLRRFYCGQLPDLNVPPPFALAATERGTLRLQAGARAVESEKLQWQADRWHRIEAVWGKSGLRLSVDGAVVAATGEAVDTVPCGARMHVGSRAWMGVQREREYPSRWKDHPTDFSQPAGGAIDDFEILGPDGQALFTLTFDGHADSVQGVAGNRLKVGYRCTPGVADMNADGHADMVMMLGDGRRGHGSEPEQRTWGDGMLYLFPGTAPQAAGIPAIAAPVLLTHDDGAPLRCHIRTKVTPVDWDGDGRIDLITSTEDHGGAAINRAVDLFRNVGTPTQPRFAARQPMERLNGMLNAQHDVKVNAVDLTGNGKLDLVTSTDPGTCVFYRSFLDEEPVHVSIKEVRR